MHTTRGAAAFGDLTRAHWNLVNYRPYDAFTKTRYLQMSFDKASYAAPQPPVHIMAIENNRFVIYNPEENVEIEFESAIWEDVKKAITKLRKTQEPCSIESIANYGFEFGGQAVGKTRMKPKLREWVEEGRLEIVSEGKRKGQLRVNQVWEDQNF